MTPALGDIGKRLLLGRKLRSTQLGETLLPKRIALPVFASDALSSVAYAPDEIFLTLSIAGLAALTISWKISLAVAVVLVVVVLSYRQNVHAYPSGGGDYEVANTNLGPTAGLTVASALLVDYVLTVAVSISSAAQYAASAIPALEGHQVTVAVIAILFLTTMNLRGVRESGAAFAIPTYIFMFTILGMAAWGFGRMLFGELPEASSASFDIAAEDQFAQGASGLAMAFLILRAFSSGCAALTGVEAISNGVPAFKKPKSKNAATTLALLGSISILMVISVVTLANVMKVRFVEDPAHQLSRDGVPVGADFHQDPVIGQLAKGIFDHFSPGFYLVAAATGIILVLAANTAFNGFPVLGSILARDGYLPRQLHTRGDRLAFSNGIIILAGFAIVLIVAFDAEVTKLIQLYIVGVFVSFTVSQTGMVRHWTRLLRDEQDPAARARMVRSRVINAVGLTLTGIVLIIVLITKFLLGAYIAIIAMAALFLLMKGIRRHYETVRKQTAVEGDETLMLPSRVHSIVLVSKLHRPTLRALAFAKAARPYTLEAVTVDVDRDESDALQADWERLGIPIPLKRLASPYREITRPILQYVRDIRRQSPRDVVTVYIPEYVVGHWWEHLLHNQSALRLKGRLLFTPGVMVTSVPYQLISSQAAEERQDREDRVAGQIRRGPRKTSGDR
ncbi:APC family permease [Kribbella sandramycini]|uniref:Amino acid transporter n=1 Tax=Kribbella sandramycini TaxID=60450 RepID=A0A841SCE5_9ACTN|nr:amino acid transporter [Kribbella sandramycini]